MHLNLNSLLSTLVAKKYVAAKDAGDLLFSSTQLTTIQASGIPFQLRYCPALAKKPTPTKTKDETLSSQPKKKPNPFHDPSPSLLITPIPANADPQQQSHILVLNKYPVIPSHFILASKKYRRQTDLLEKNDIAAAYACIREWDSEREKRGGEEKEDENKTSSSRRSSDSPDDGTEKRRKKRRRLFVFFNSGPHSGASQPHRHLQFLPVESMEEDSSESSISPNPLSLPRRTQPWSLLSDSITSPDRDRQPPILNTLPLTVFTARLPKPSGAGASTPASADDLHKTYLDLYRQAVEACERYASTHPGERTSIFSSLYDDIELENTDIAEADEGGTVIPATISYNLSLTSTSMALCPRRAEGAMLWGDEEEGEEEEEEADSRDTNLGVEKESFVGEGKIALNGTILAGTLMVKTEREWDELKKRPEKLERVLEAVGIPVPVTHDLNHK